ncbi:hypothetical protein Vi05172_g1737 [Venturia inaequalis]|nr:hypothetical protein Vi05172_g1737 [Venturia inaequalis]
MAAQVTAAQVAAAQVTAAHITAAQITSTSSPIPTTSSCPEDRRKRAEECAADKNDAFNRCNDQVCRCWSDGLRRKCYENCQYEFRQEINQIVSSWSQFNCEDKLFPTSSTTSLPSTLSIWNTSSFNSATGGASTPPPSSISENTTIFITSNGNATTVIADNGQRSSGTSNPILRQPGALAGLFLGCTAGMALLIFGVIILVLKRRTKQRAQALGNGNNASGEVIMLEVGAGGQISRKGTSSGGDVLGDFKSFGQRDVVDGRDGQDKETAEGDQLAKSQKDAYRNVYR